MSNEKQKKSQKKRKAKENSKYFVIKKACNNFSKTKDSLNVRLLRKCSCNEAINKSKKDQFQFHQRSCKFTMQTCSIRFYSIRGRTYISLKFYLFHFIFWLLFICPALNVFSSNLSRSVTFPFGGAIFVHACHPGSKEGGSNRLHPTANLNPFQIDEFYPKMSEQTIGASGPAVGPIYKDTKRYRDELTPNFNPDIVFLDEEETNEDRMMTRRCMDRLNMLAIWVINQWPDVKLRVTEAWDDPEVQGVLDVDSLHYEGRAVDITTTDQDRSKYPVLARMAVEAGFDWVQLKPTHVHCSVKSESSPASENGGCFPGESMVRTTAGSLKRLDALCPGDEVFSMDSSGRIISDKILSFIDVQQDRHASKTTRKRIFVSIETMSGTTLRLTPNHLIYKQEIITVRTKNATEAKKYFSSTVLFASKVRPGDVVYAVDFSSNFSAIVRPTKVVQTKRILLASGAYAPLTEQGTIVIDDVVASCYAVIESHKVAHVAMTPLRYYHIIRNWLFLSHTSQFDKSPNASNQNYCCQRQSPEHKDGISFYAKMLFDVIASIFPQFIFQNLSPVP